MKVPSNYTGVLLFDDSIPPQQIKLNNEGKGILKQILQLIQQNTGKNLSKDLETNRLISCIIILLNLNLNTVSNISLGYKFYRLFYLSTVGKLITVKGEYKNKKDHKHINLIGMDNFATTTCYLDSLLVALFYSNSSFDFLLDKSKDPHSSNDFQIQIERLKTILRFIVNLLRSGEHININIMYQLLLVLNSLGCDMVLSGKQQDSLQIFEFLAESLSLPLLTLKLDIIHTGKLNINDDFRLIGERTLLVSIPSSNSNSNSNLALNSSSSSLENSVTLEDCLNSYFNNSVTVRRHIDQKLNTSKGKFYKNLNTDDLKNNIEKDCQNISESKESFQQHEIDEYEKVGILKMNDLSSTSIPQPSECENESVLENNITPVQSNSIVSQTITPSLFKNSNTPSITDYSPLTTTNNVISNSTASTTNNNNNNNNNSTITDSNSITRIGSYNNVNEKLERQRTRSSTIASVLNNVQISNPNNRLTRRSSSISNTEVSLPAWMYLQLLPYYTNPDVKLTFENHEEYYRRTSRSKTIDSTQIKFNNIANSNINDNIDSNDPRYNPFSNLENGEEEDEEQESYNYFNQRFESRRPIVPICLKRYIWNERGQSIKINTKVVIPQIIKYPYFIAEDNKKPGFVDFRRSFDHKAPRGSFMLILQSCVCHRGKTINSGHYVSIIRKKPLELSTISNESLDDSEWILFNDLEIGKDKAKTYTFDEVMKNDDPYLLFYEIYEIKDSIVLSPPIGSKDLYWNRKQSIISGLSGISDRTLNDDNNSSLVDDNLKNYSSKHIKHLSLAGLSLSKSKSKNLNLENDDVLNEFYWYDSTLNYNKSVPSFFKNENNHSNINSNNNSNINININNTSTYSYNPIKDSVYTSSIKTSINNDEINQYDDSPQVHVMEVEESESTRISKEYGDNDDNTNKNNSYDTNNSYGAGEIDYVDTNEEKIDTSSILASNNKNNDHHHGDIYHHHHHHHNNSFLNPLADTKSRVSHLSNATIIKDTIEKEKVKDKSKGKLKRQGTVKKLFKKVFS